MEGNPKVCKRCLTREMAESAGEFQSIKDYIDNLDADIKAPKEVYENRLETCKQCEMLLTGMCRSCGCYVEMRAAIQKRECPRKKW